MTDDPRGPAAPGDDDNPLAMLAGGDAASPKPQPKPKAQSKAKAAPGAKKKAAAPSSGKRPGRARAPRQAGAAPTGAAAAAGGPGASGPAPGAKRPPVGGEGPPAQASLVGVGMIVIAVLIGAFLLAKGYDTEGTVVAGSSPTTVAKAQEPAPTGLTTTSTTPGSTTTTQALRPPSEVSVRVANGGGEEGVAVAGTNKLSTAGYETLGAVDVPQAQRTGKSNVYYASGFEAEAIEIAGVFDIAEENVAAMPSSPPVDPGGADVLVILGPDQKLS